MANPITDDIGTPPSQMRARVPLFNLIGRADDLLYSVERVVVVASLAIMTIASFLKVLADFVDKRETMGVTYAVTFASFWIIGRVAASASPLIKDNALMSHLTGILWGVIAVVYVWLVAAVPSSTVVVIHVLVSGLMLLYFEIARPIAMDASTFNLRRIVRLGLILIATAGGLWVGGKIESGYSWAPQIALVLLLWMAFLGASMATYEGKHLAVDAVRKLVPPHRERLFNTLSQGLAGAITAAFLYLAVSYVLKRLGEEPEPGKIPDWLKVLSIPVSLGIMSIRFFGYSIADAVGAIMKVEPDAPAPDMLTGAAPTNATTEVSA